LERGARSSPEATRVFSAIARGIESEAAAKEIGPASSGSP